MDYLLLLPIIVPFFAAPVCYAWGKSRGSSAVSVTAALASLIIAAMLVWQGDITLVINGAYPLSLKLDGFRAIQIAVTSLVWIFTSLFQDEYFEKTGSGGLKRYKLFTMITLGAVSGVFLSVNLFTMFIFFEIMSLASFVLVAHRGNTAAKEAGNIYLAVSVIAGMVSLMGLFLLNNLLGTLELEAMGQAAAKADKAALYTAAGLAAVGFAAKAGLYPLHIWLPKSYLVSPAPATAVLSSVLSKAGVFGVISISSTVFVKDGKWGGVLLVAAVVTMLWGGFCALFSGDMKKILAYSSMSQIGFIFFGIGVQSIAGEGLSQGGYLLHMLNHSAVKLVLFTLCGILLANAGTTLLSKIKGYGRNNPVFAAAFIICALGLGGIPLFSGYVSKTLLHEGVVELAHSVQGSQSSVFVMFEWLFLLAGGLTVAYLLKITFFLFAKTKEKYNKSMGLMTRLCILVPCIYVLAVGILPNITADKIQSFAGIQTHGLNYFSLTNLGGSAISIGIGVGIFILYRLVFFGKKLPKKDFASLEKYVYRPLLFKLIPFLLGAVSTFMDRYIVVFIYKGAMLLMELYAKIAAGLTDSFVEVLVLLGFKPAKEKDLGGKRVPATYRLGNLLDKADAIVHKQPEKTGVYAQALSKYEEQAAVRRRMISSSLSYGLLFAGIGLIVVLIYLVLN